MDVVLRRRVPEQLPRLREGGAARQPSGGLAAAGGVLDRHRHRLAAVRGHVQAPRRDRAGADRRHRHERVRDRPLFRIHRPARGRALHRERLPGPARPLARAGRSDAAGAVRGPLQRADVRPDPAAREANAPGPHHRGQQHPERAVHDRQQRHRRCHAERGPQHPADLPGGGHRQCGGGGLHLPDRAGIPAALRRLRADAAGLPLPHRA
mmetsp:Transcript_3271/g.5941  ORF Transcript_3271/g.5941 Transcript_3271/m.5941 type:complete len:209 (-) Transcript_3271:729-1355(-)